MRRWKQNRSPNDDDKVFMTAKDHERNQQQKKNIQKMKMKR